MIIRAKLARISETHPKTALILVQARLEQLVFHQKLKRSTCRKIGPTWSDFSIQSISVFLIYRAKKIWPNWPELNHKQRYQCREAHRRDIMQSPRCSMPSFTHFIRSF